MYIQNPRCALRRTKSAVNQPFLVFPPLLESDASPRCLPLDATSNSSQKLMQHRASGFGPRASAGQPTDPAGYCHCPSGSAPRGLHSGTGGRAS
ncbi:hypothetical protein BDY21DRAFT_343693 [Lineolata rhizophorae]|uniref:Uncharacterized protein n=1 Tax=Lineolata rhizophorae TaxID=578093 RepID=A0A6A6P0Y2_9PEZI|nr:hypothetical protein BDY21DRAFT_343693 [Lineolata rhizophorae]